MKLNPLSNVRSGVDLCCCVLVAALFAGNAVAGKRTITPFDLATIRDVDGLSVSPDGAWAAFQVRQADPHRNRYESAWYVAPTAGGGAQRIADAGDPILSKGFIIVGEVIAVPAAWSPDSRSIAYIRKDSGGTRLWLSSRDGQRTDAVPPVDGEVVALAFDRKGTRLFFRTEPTETQRNASLAAEGLSGYLYDRRFWPVYSRLPLYPADLKVDENHGLHSASLDQQRSIRVYDLGRRIVRAATEAEVDEFATLTSSPAPRDRPNARGGSAVSRGGSTAWTEALDPERQGSWAPLTIVARTGRGSETHVCGHLECTGRIHNVWWRGEDEIVFERIEVPGLNDRALYGWNLRSNAIRPILRTDHLFFSDSCGIGNDALICFYEEPARPRRLVAIQLRSGAVVDLHDPNPHFSQLHLGAPPERMTFRSPTGVESWGYLVLPPDYRMGDRLSLVVVTYRASGFLRGGMGDEYPVFPFAAAGNAVLVYHVPDYDAALKGRLSVSDYDKQERGPGDREKRRVHEGLRSVIVHLDASGIVDPERVVLTGLSYGADTVAYNLINMPKLAAAITSGPGIEPSYIFLSGGWGYEEVRSLGLASPTNSRWDSLSVSRNADKVCAPLLMNVPDHEVIMALESYTALEAVRRPVEMYVFPDEYHVKWQPVHRLSIYERNIDWVDFWLRDREDPAPAKAGQYARWRTLKSAWRQERQSGYCASMSETR